MKILIVDDDKDVREYIGQLLGNQGHVVSEAVNGREGLARAREHRPDVIISDGLMPVMDGFQLLQALKSDAELSSVPFIFFSAVYTGEREQGLARSLGADAFIVKPQPPEAILQIVRDATDGRKAAERNKPALTGSDTEFAKEYSRVVATALEKKVRQLETVAHNLERTKKEFQESEVVYRGLFENNPHPMWIFDVETLGFLAVNNAAIHKYGYSREEFLSMTIKDIRPPEDVHALLKKISNVTDGLDEAGIWRHRKKDGTIIDTEIIGHRLDFGGRSADLVLANDVTEHKRMEKAIREACDEWRSTFDAMNDAIALLDKDGKILRCNRAMADLVKKPFHEIIGRQCWEVIHGTSGPVADCPHEIMKKTLKRENLTAQLGERWFDVTADPFFDTEGNLAGVIHIMSDVTERKLNENLIHNIARQQKAILNNIPDMAWLKDGEGRFIAVNEPFGRACGLKPEELAGKTDFDIWPRELAERYLADDREVMLSGKRKLVEEPLADKEEKTAWIETIKTPIYDERGSVIGTTGIARDITARKISEDALRASEEMHRLIFLSSPVGIFHYDVNLIITDCNDRFVELLKSKREELIGLDMRRLKDQRVLPSLEAAIKGEEGWYEGGYKATTGSDEIWISMRTATLLNDKGMANGGIAIVEDISGRKRAEEALKESESKFRSLTEQTLVGTYILQDNVFKYVNPRFAGIFGYSAEELTGLMGPMILTLPEDQALVRENIRKRESREVEFIQYEFRGVRKDGRIIHIELLGANITYQGRHAVIGTLQDITERKRAEEALKASEEKFRTFFESADDSIFILDLQGNFIDINTTAYERLGYTKEEMMSRHVSQLDPPEFSARVPERMEQIRKYGKAVFESAHIKKDGSVMPVEINSIVINYEGRKALFSIVRDITERKLAEEQIFQAKQNWEFTFNSITDMVTVHDADYNIILANKAAQKILNLPLLEKMKDRKCFSYYHGTDHAPEGCPSCGCLQTGVSADFEIFEPHLNMFIEIRAIPRFDSGNNLIGLIHVVRDITERKKLEQQIKSHTEQLETVVKERTRDLEDANTELQVVNRELVLRREEADAASRSKTDFLANMSHELRTPLNAIMGFSEIMLMGMAGTVSEKQREFLGDISKSGNHLLSLINDILDLSKVESGKVELELGQVIITELISGSLMMFKEKSLKHRIKVETDIEAQVMYIVGDRRMLKQVLVNLLSNAFKFTPDGGGVRVAARRVQSSEDKVQGSKDKVQSSEFKVQSEDLKNTELRTLNSELNADFIEISVADTGVGIPREQQGKLFQPFQQIDSSLTRKHAGTGLGLSLCRRFVELHGGRIWVESEQGKGSTFRFVIPVRGVK